LSASDRSVASRPDTALPPAEDGDPQATRNSYFGLISPDVRPQDDLFRHVNGHWLKTVSLPEDRTSSGTLTDLRETTERQLRAILERAAAGEAQEGSDEQKIGDLYASLLDEQLSERLGSTPLRSSLQHIAGIDSIRSLARTLGHMQRNGVTGAFRIYVSADARNSDRNVLYLAQAGLGLPDEFYYRDEGAAAIRAGYVAHLEKMLRLAGLADPRQAAARVFALEARLAAAHWDRVSTRDVVRGYTPVERSELNQLAPRFDWAEWLAGLDAPASALSRVIVRQPGFLRALSDALGEFDLADWRDWLAWRLIRTTAPLLNQEFTETSFAFYGTLLTGVPEQRPRWKRGIQIVQNSLGEALGRLYVAEHFPPRSKELILDLVANLIQAQSNNIEELPWMGPETKERALNKLGSFTAKIGYPDRWCDFSTVRIRRDDLVGNVQRADSAEIGRYLAKIGQPIDRDEWFVTPQTVNASYMASTNQIVIPAAILQQPFFHPENDPAVNYGAIGAVIGHEICHGFDDQGSRYDGHGNLTDWWTESDRASFEERNKALIAQFNALAPEQTPGQHVNGELTAGENIGDLGGLRVAYRAYLHSLGNTEPPVIEGLTGPQRFFMSWARIWRGKAHDEEMARRLVVDPHSPGEFRCNAILRNLDEFHRAFNTQPGDDLWLPPGDRVRIW
jgi:putative endopeptidase